MFGIDDIVIGSIIASGVSSIANTTLGFMNNNYQKNLQNRMFDREDTSIARRVADLKAAGLSPVLAAGQGANAGPVVQVKQPEVDTQVIQGLQNLLTMQKDFAVKDQQIKTLQSQSALNDATSRIKRWDLAKYIQSGTASNASGIAKTIRDLFGMSDSPLVNTVKKTIDDKVRGVLNEIPSDYTPGFNKDSEKNYRKMNKQQKESHKNKLWERIQQLQNK